MRLYSSNALFQVLFQNSVWKKNTSQKTVYLTFDDGPTPEVTPFVLEQLAAYDAKATFFCVGANVEKHARLYQNVLNAGHRVGNHTQTHLNAYSVSRKAWKADFEKAERVIESNLVRPPYGALTWPLERYLTKKGYEVIMWSFITYDFDEKSDPERALRLLKKRKGFGDIVVMHDQPRAQKNIETLLPEALRFYKSEGFSFGVL